MDDGQGCWHPSMLPSGRLLGSGSEDVAVFLAEEIAEELVWEAPTIGADEVTLFVVQACESHESKDASGARATAGEGGGGESAAVPVLSLTGHAVLLPDEVGLMGERSVPLVVPVGFQVRKVASFPDCRRARRWWWTVDDVAADAVAAAVVYSSGQAAYGGGAPLAAGRCVYVAVRDGSDACVVDRVRHPVVPGVLLHHWLRRVVTLPSAAPLPPASPAVTWRMAQVTVVCQVWAILGARNAAGVTSPGWFRSPDGQVAWVRRQLSAPCPSGWGEDWEEAYRCTVASQLLEGSPEHPRHPLGGADLDASDPLDALAELRFALWSDAALWAAEEADGVCSPGEVAERVSALARSGEMSELVAELLLDACRV